MTTSRWYVPREPDDFATYDGPHAPDPATLLPHAIAACVCGWHPSNHRGFWLADHLADMGVPGYAPVPERSDTGMRQQ